MWNQVALDYYFDNNENFINRYCRNHTITALGLAPGNAGNINAELVTDARLVAERIAMIMPHAVHNSPHWNTPRQPWLVVGRLRGANGTINSITRVCFVVLGGEFRVVLKVGRENGALFASDIVRIHDVTMHFAGPREDVWGDAWVSDFDVRPDDDGHFSVNHPLSDGQLFCEFLRLVDNERYQGYYRDVTRFGELNNLVGNFNVLCPRIYQDLDELPPPPPPPPPLDTMPLNSIFYGPPGTGKTHATPREALKRLGSVFTEAEVRTNFSTACSDGRVVFTTFHQSYSYEDFIEGLRAETSADGRISYKIKNGIFKKIARKALFNFAAKLLDINAGTKSAQLYSETLDSELHALVGHPVVQNDPQFWQVIDKIAAVLSSPSEVVEPNFSAMNRFVLIVDEINRGNISKVFGELITLIEDDKRLGKKNALSATLPYSGERFLVPANLYIIGTMNTADRSLAAFDVALRRRFQFEEMVPDFTNQGPLTGLTVEGINVCEWMNAINRRIQAERGREFTIGHAFFMGLLGAGNNTLKNLAGIMEKKILPLLEEYFFDDWEGIRYVLNESDIQPDQPCFVKKDPMVLRGGRDTFIYGWKKEYLEDARAYR